MIMAVIYEFDSEQISKDGTRFIERDTMLLKIRSCLVVILFKTSITCNIRNTCILSKNPELPVSPDNTLDYQFYGTKII